MSALAPELLRERHGAVLVLRLNRPDASNALTPTLLQDIGAAVVLKSGADASPAELSAYVKARLAAYKYPRRVWLTESLPKGPTGKILRREVTIPPEADPT